MNKEQIKIANSILKIFAENSWSTTDKVVYQKMGENGFEKEIVQPVYLMLINDYHLLVRSPNPERKQLNENGSKAFEIGLEKYLRRTVKIERFFNSPLSRIIQFLIPTIIATIALFN